MRMTSFSFNIVEREGEREREEEKRKSRRETNCPSPVVNILFMSVAYSHSLFTWVQDVPLAPVLLTEYVDQALVGSAVLAAVLLETHDFSSCFYFLLLLSELNSVHCHFVTYKVDATSLF